MSDAHELLPWYVNGTLDDEERARFKDHLAACQACREEMAVIEDLREQLRNPDWDLMAEHPSPETLAAVFMDGAGDAATRRHVALCLTCAEEVRWLKGEAAPARKRRASRAPMSRWAGRAALAAAAVLMVALAVGVLPRPAGTGRVTGMLPFQLVPSVQRAGAEPHVVNVLAGATDVYLLFEVDLGPEDFPASFRVVDAAGRPVFSSIGMQPADLYRGTFLFFDCRRNDCPDGSYVGRLSPAKAGSPDVEYPFRLATP